MDEQHVAVLMGGKSSEHDVSLRSGAGVSEALEKEGFRVTPVTIGLDGAWRFGEADALRFVEAAPHLVAIRPDCVFIALHGGHGEDGHIQSVLDLLELPYTGSGPAACALALDKLRSKSVVNAQGVRVAGHIALDELSWEQSRDEVIEMILEEIGAPCVVKAPNDGSSRNMAIVRTPEQLVPALDKIVRVEGTAMVEEFVEGAEVTCGILDAEEDGRVLALPVTEIRPLSSSYFDYEAKYTPGATEEITPADLPDEIYQEVQEMAADAHQILGCSGWSRSDFIINDDGEPIWLELNTVPGLTETSLYPQAAAVEDISYEQMVRLFVEDGIRRRGPKRG